LSLSAPATTPSAGSAFADVGGIADDFDSIYQKKIWTFI
jgi:hypothetical protein